MNNARRKAINTSIQAAFPSVLGLLLIIGGVMLWSGGTAPAYIGAASVIVIGLSVLWWLVLQPLLKLRKPEAAGKRSSAGIPAHTM